MRRDHVKYLSLIASLTLLHQHQREQIVRQRDGQEETCVIATLEDVEIANQLASEAFGTSLDGLMPQTRQLLILLDDYIQQLTAKKKVPREAIRFTQRELREAFGWGDFQLRRHLKRLLELEYVLRHHGGNRNQREYQLLYQGEGRDGSPFLLGLIDAAKLRQSPSKTARRKTAKKAETIDSKSKTIGPKAKTIT